MSQRLKMAIRLFTGIMLPPPLGLVSLLFVNSTSTIFFGEDPVFIGFDFSGMDLEGFWAFAFISYIYVSTQAVLYSLCMEFIGQRILHKMKRGGRPAFLIFSSLLGTLAGASFLEIKFALAGALTGLVVGFLLLFMSRSPEHPPASYSSPHT